MADEPEIRCRCRPRWGSCNLPAGHAGQHNANATTEWTPAEIEEYQQRWREDFDDDA